MDSPVTLNRLIWKIGKFLVSLPPMFVWDISQARFHRPFLIGWLLANQRIVLKTFQSWSTLANGWHVNFEIVDSALGGTRKCFLKADWSISLAGFALWRPLQDNGSSTRYDVWWNGFPKEVWKGTVLPIYNFLPSWQKLTQFRFGKIGVRQDRRSMKMKRKRMNLTLTS